MIQRGMDTVMRFVGLKVDKNVKIPAGKNKRKKVSPEKGGEPIEESQNRL